MHNGKIITWFFVLSFACLIAGAFATTLNQPTPAATLSPTPAHTSTPAPTASSTPVPTADVAATTNANAIAAGYVAGTNVAATSTSAAVATASELQRAEQQRLDRAANDAAQLNAASLTEVWYRVELLRQTVTAAPTAASIAATEAQRQLWRQVAIDNAADAAELERIANQHNNAIITDNVGAGAGWLWMIGTPAVVLASLYVIAGAVANRIAADRDVELQRLAYEQRQRDWENEIQGRRADILHDGDLVPINTRRSTHGIDTRMTPERLRAFVDACVLYSGPTSTVLTPSTDERWTSHGEWSACAAELYRLGWIDKPERGKPTSLTGDAMLGEIQSSLAPVNADADRPARQTADAVAG